MVMKNFRGQVFFHNLWVLKCPSEVLACRFELVRRVIESNPETLGNSCKEEGHQGLMRVLNQHFLPSVKNQWSVDMRSLQRDLDSCWYLFLVIVPLRNPGVVTGDDFSGVVHRGNVQSCGRIEK